MEPNTIKYTFTKKERLHSASEFKKVLQKGEVYSNEYLKVFLFTSDPNQRFSRLGLIVSHKLSNSVNRNRLKRRLREIFRLNKHRLKRKVDIVIIPNRNSVFVDYHILENNILKILRDADLI